MGGPPHAAVKGPDGIFYWDLDRPPEITPGGVVPTRTEFVGSMRESYAVWFYTSCSSGRFRHGTSKFLLGITRPKVVQLWARFTYGLLLQASSNGPPAAAPPGVVPYVASAVRRANAKDSLMYTVAYWIKWKPVDDTSSDHLLFFGEKRNMPALVRGHRLGALVEDEFCSTDFDPRLAGENWCLLVVTNDGTYSTFYIGYATDDRSGAPRPCKSLEQEPGKSAHAVQTVMGADVELRRLVTTSKGAGHLAQAWIWASALAAHEIEELWTETKERYPLRTEAPAAPSSKEWTAPPKPALATGGGRLGDAGGAAGGGSSGGGGGPLSWDADDPIIAKDNEAMLSVPVSSKLVFQQLVHAISTLIEYVLLMGCAIVIDRVHNCSPTAELMIEVVLRKRGVTPPTVLVIDSRPRLEVRNRLSLPVRPHTAAHAYPAVSQMC